ncbi:ParA family protein [Auritidibacter ignavus]|uniref:ParA family protein n=1 Tax=Auritidibacter ignavus TaxID=678932 RepID=UPI0024474F54|nr:ParA family protein [Auritidibacter ignavus]WGH84629.1 ParA family protein [Auritidibacter ignavus]WGH86940.1 ParA family protein [Auritidibacter ignavus]WGH89225.1 ParA family protein [Auritidibacter ignavus]WHS27709.1 ParA family protein [Auritidibacter ignavus]
MQVISISSLKGGVGKTSVTLGLASAARTAGMSTLVIDLDPHADATTGLGMKQGLNTQDIGTLLRKPKKADLNTNAEPAGWTESDAEPSSPISGSRLDVVRGSSTTSMFERISTRSRDVNRLAVALDRVRGYDLVLIDCPPALNGVTRIAWAASTDVVLVAEPSLFSVAGTERTLRALDQFRREFAPSIKSIRVLANRVRTASTEHKYRLTEMERMYGDRLLPLSIPEISNWQQIQGAAWPIHLWPGETAARTARQFDQLLQEITQQQESSRRSRRAQ